MRFIRLTYGSAVLVLLLRTFGYLVWSAWLYRAERDFQSRMLTYHLLVPEQVPVQTVPPEPRFDEPERDMAVLLGCIRSLCCSPSDGGF